MKLKLEDLEGIKLVDESYILDVEEVRTELERAYQQGSQGWGVRREVGIYLALARDLKVAMQLAATADEAQRMLKGCQLEGGRLKKRVKELDAELLARDLRIKELETSVDAKERSIEMLQTEVEQALNARVPLSNQEPGTVIESHKEVDSDE